MNVKLWNIVVFAENYKELIQWYLDVFSLEILVQKTGDYNYTELGSENKVLIGITPGSEVSHQPNNPRNNACVMQLDVSDIKELLTKAKDLGGKILFGPTLEEQSQFYFGAISDIEGNQIWLFQNAKTK